MIIAHQYPADRIARLSTHVPEVEFLAVSADAAFAVPEGVEVLLVDPQHVGKLNRSTPRPPGWPGGLKWLHFRSTGVDYLPDWIFEAPLLTVSRGAQATAISEFVLANMLAFEKRLDEIRVRQLDDWRKLDLGGLAGRTVGILGFGQIGQAIARRALAFKMTVLGHRRSGGDSGMDGVAAVSLDDLLVGSDHLVICAPLTEATRNLLSEPEFAAMRRGVHLVNISRGALIDEAALKAALDSGQVARASLDVSYPEPPEAQNWLYSHPHVWLSAHLSYSSPMTESIIDDILVRNLTAWTRGAVAELHGRVSREAGY
ncbi:MAG: NAD(P)-dependent oxidoreductase [Cypionkella sp.]